MKKHMDYLIQMPREKRFKLRTLYLTSMGGDCTGLSKEEAEIEEKKNTTLTQEACDALREVGVYSTALETLKLFGFRLTVRDMEALIDIVKYSETLTTLDLSYSTTCNMKMMMLLLQQIKDNGVLKTLNLHGVGQVGGMYSLSSVIRRNTSLTSLNIGETDVSAKQLEHILRAVDVNTTLTTLNMWWTSPNRTLDLGRVLRRNTTLTKLDLSNGHVRIKDTMPKIVSLQDLNLRWTRLEQSERSKLIESLRDNTSLHTLDISNNGLRDHDIAEIGEILQTNTTLRVVNIFSRATSAITVKTLSEVIKVNSTLERLRFATHDGYNENIDRCLPEALAVNNTLTSLEINFDGIPFEQSSDISGLCQAFITNTSMTTLNLRGSIILRYQDTQNVIAKLVRQNNTLRSLNVPIYDASNIHELELIEALRCNTTLLRVNLPNFPHFYLKKNESLYDLLLGHCSDFWDDE